MTKAETPQNEREAINKSRGYMLFLVFLFTCILGFGVPFAFSGGASRIRSEGLMTLNGQGDISTPTLSPSPTMTAEALLLPVTGSTLTQTATTISSPTPTITQTSLSPTVAVTQTSTPTLTLTPSPTSTQTPVNTLRPSNTPNPTKTRTPLPTNTSVPPTNTQIPSPTNTSIPPPTNTRTSAPTNVPTRLPTNTPAPPNNTPVIPRTNTPIPPNTPAPTNAGGCQSEPSSPTLNADLGNEGRVRLTWDRVSGAVAYQVYRSTSGNTNRGAPLDGPTNGTSKTDNIPPNSTYSYRVVAFNACGNGISNVVTVSRGE